MKPIFISTFSLIIFSLVLGISVATSAEPIQLPDGAIVLAQTNGMDRRQDRRDTRQDCRSEGGLMGADKRNCKQDGRNSDGEATEPMTDDTNKQ